MEKMLSWALLLIILVTFCCHHHSSKLKRNSPLKMALLWSYGLPPYYSVAFLSKVLFNKFEHVASNYDVTHFRVFKLQRHLLSYSLALFQLLTVFVCGQGLPIFLLSLDLTYKTH